jgi:hypothetical protein
MKHILLILLLFISACGIGTNTNDLTGRWKGQDDKDGIMVFNKDGSFEALDSNGQSLLNVGPNPLITWEIITEVEPFQLYITIIVDGKTERIPIGIYKIKNGKLILCEPLTFYRSIDGINMGVSRYEMPNDFSGVLHVFKKL